MKHYYKNVPVRTIIQGDAGMTTELPRVRAEIYAGPFPYMYYYMLSWHDGSNIENPTWIPLTEEMRADFGFKTCYRKANEAVERVWNRLDSERTINQ